MHLFLESHTACLHDSMRQLGYLLSRDSAFWLAGRQWRRRSVSACGFKHLLRRTRKRGINGVRLPCLQVPAPATLACMHSGAATWTEEGQA